MEKPLRTAAAEWKSKYCGRNPVLFVDAVKIDRLATLLACSQGLLVIPSPGREQALLRRERKARAWVTKSKGGTSIRSFVLRTYTVGGLGVKKVHID